MGLFKSLDGISDMPSTPVGVKFTTIEYTFDSFLEKLNNDELSAHQIRNKIIFSYSSFANYDNLVNPNTRKALKRIWTNKKFLYNLYQVLQDNTIKTDILEIKTVNKIVFDYCFDSDDPDPEIMKLMIKIADIINFNLKLVFSTIMQPTIASQLAILSRSSFESKDCIDRVNKYISKFEFTVDNIIYIYSKLYLEDFSSLFLYTLISKEPEEKNVDRAIITILDSMTSNEIFKVLQRYGYYINMNNITDVRFKLSTIFNNKSRIGRIIEDLKYDNVIIP